MLKIKAMVLHLERATGRRANVDALRKSAQLETEIVSAVDGALLTAAETARIYIRERFLPRYPFTLCPAEIGAFASHRSAWARIVSEGLDFAIVFEDDARIDPGVFADLTALLKAEPDVVDYALLPAQSVAPRGRAAFHGRFTIVEPDAPPLRAIAQIVSRRAAERLLAVSQPFDRPIDTFLQMVWVTGQPILVVAPSGVGDESVPSGGTTVGRNSMGFIQKIHHEVARPLYRSKVRTLWRRGTRTL